MKTSKPRIPKSKEELIAKQKQDQKIAKWVALTKLMWPLIENQEKIYDTQTTFNALAGYIELGIKIKQDALKVGELGIDISKEDNSLIKTSMVNLLGLLETENAFDTMTLARKIADMIGQYGASEFVKGPMSGLKVTDIVK